MDSERIRFAERYIEQVIIGICTNKANAKITPVSASKVEVEHAVVADISAMMNRLAKSPKFELHRTINGASLTLKK